LKRKRFTGLDSIVVDTGKGFPVTKLIDVSKSHHTPDTVILIAATISLKPGDVVYAANSGYLSTTWNFCLKFDVQCPWPENIDSLAMMFYDSTHAATTSWANMSSISLYVRARTAAPDNFTSMPVS